MSQDSSVNAILSHIYLDLHKGNLSLSGVRSALDRLSPYTFYGFVESVTGLLISVSGLNQRLSVGARCHIHPRSGPPRVAEVVGFQDNQALVMPFLGLEGIGPKCRVDFLEEAPRVYPHAQWLGRVVNGFGDAIDGKGALPLSGTGRLVQGTPPPAHERDRVGKRLDMGVRSINTFLTCCRGQRMGIFAGSGVGKSTLLSQIARFSDATVNVIGLIGERGREVQEFIEDYLGEEGLKRSVIIVATSDESPVMRVQAAHMTLAIAEYFRDEGQDVLCLMDSVTRFSMAGREIGLSVGEPPTTKGYTPSVFAALPKLLERAGPGLKTQKGSITGLFTVLVEGDDHNEPISDAVRGILDGHIVLERAIAERGRFPPINILRSVSRMMPGCNQEVEQTNIAQARQLMSTYEDMADMIRLGAYKKGSDPGVDKAILYREPLERFLSQQTSEETPLPEGFTRLSELLKGASK
ncbi:MAG: flagellar protein export ATPase FliI [bacterium]|nr:flagellar protein export ATPase FliI [bacterium]